MSKITDTLKDVDTDDIIFVVELGSTLIAQGIKIIQTLTEQKNYSVSELIDLANTSVEARSEAQAKAHEYIKAKLAEANT